MRELRHAHGEDSAACRGFLPVVTQLGLQALKADI